MGPAEEMNERDKKKLAHAEIGGNDGVRHEVGGRGGEHKNMMKDIGRNIGGRGGERHNEVGRGGEHENMMKDIGRGMMGDPKPNDQSGKYGKRR